MADNVPRRFGRIEVTDHLKASLDYMSPVRGPEFHLVMQSQVFVDFILHLRLSAPHRFMNLTTIEDGIRTIRPSINLA
jgi:hypothetical protein